MAVDVSGKTGKTEPVISGEEQCGAMDRHKKSNHLMNQSRFPDRPVLFAEYPVQHAG